MARPRAVARPYARRHASRRTRPAALVAAWICLGVPAGAQSARAGGAGLELRADAIVAHLTAVHAGAGIALPLGSYVRLDAVGGAGTLLGRGRSALSTRADVVGRFLLDPFGQFRRSAYVGGGVGVRHDDGDTRGSLLAVVGIEVRPRRGYAPAFELGLGGGVRVGVVLRPAGEASR